MRIFFLVILVILLFLLSLLFLKFSAEIRYAEKNFEIKLKSGVIRFKIKSGKRKKKPKKPKKEDDKKSRTNEKDYSEKLDKIAENYEKYKNPIINLLKYLSGRLEIRKLEIDLSYGTGDAAHTGILYGIIQILSGNLFAAAVKYLNADFPIFNIRPNFQNKCLKLDFGGIIKARPVHIIIAYFKFRSNLKNK